MTRRREAQPPRRSTWRGEGASLLHVAPYFVLYAVFGLLPIVMTIGLSFTSWNGITPPVFVGFENFTHLWTIGVLQKSFLNLFTYVIITVPLGVAVGLGLALFVDRLGGRFGAFVRSSVFLPFIMPLFITAVIWRWMFAPDYGLVNQILEGIGLHSIDWLATPSAILPALIIVDVWHSAGFNMLLTWAGLKSVPAEMREAARVDGAGTLQEVRYIILPQLRPVLFIITVNAMISAFQVFDLPWLLTKSGYLEGAGGPDQTLLFPVMTAITRGFGSLEFGEAASIGLLLLVLIGCVTATMFAIRGRLERNS